MTKLRNILILTVIAIVGIQSCSTAQVVTTDNAKKKAVNLFLDAKDAAVFNKLDETEQLLLEALAIEPNFINAHSQLADLYYTYKREYSKSIPHFEKVIEMDKTWNHNIFRNLGTAYFKTGQYEKAKGAFNEYMSKDNIKPWKRYEAELYIKNCDFIQEAKANPVEVEITPLNEAVNSAASEYYPALTADQKYIYYTVSSIDNRHTQEDIYYSVKKNGEWTGRYKLGPQINTGFGNEGAHCISPDGQYLIFTACQWPDGISGCDLYIAKKQGNSFEKAYNMGLNINSNRKDTQPSISADSRSIYYVSNRSGGHGGADIWVSHIGEDGKFAKPVNLGPKINTPLNEERPFIHPDGQSLFFASEGHPGMGDFDVYVSRLDENGEWGTPVNLGYPINTGNDERGIYISTDGSTAFYAATKENYENQIDIYKFNLPEIAKPKPVTYVKGTVRDSDTKEALSAAVELTDLKTGRIHSVAYSDKVNGEFLITIPIGKNYAYSVNKKGYLFFSENFSLENHNPEKPYVLNILLDKIKAGKKVILKNIFFDTGEFILKSESDAEINKLVNLLTKNPEMKLEIGGHTDNVGTEKDNQILSENRAKAVYNALIEKGIDEDRLTYKGYGQSQPIANNETDEGKAQNRRTEVKVIVE